MEIIDFKIMKLKIKLLLISILLIFIISFVIVIFIYDRHESDNINKINRQTDINQIKKIKHIVIIMQENRGFDSYFGTYPGADGLPSSVCIPDPESDKCVKPFHDSNDINQGGPHSGYEVGIDINNGKMDGFLKALYDNRNKYCEGKFKENNFEYCIGKPDVMGYHDSREIPNYWKYANEFVLQDHMFESVSSWTLPSHLFIVSGWSADCESSAPMSCTNEEDNPEYLKLNNTKYNQSWNINVDQPNYAWTDITYLLHKNNVSWAFYYDNIGNDLSWLELVSPLPWFQTVHENEQLENIQPLNKFFDAVKTEKLPSVVWIVPSFQNSEHPPASIKKGQSYVTNIVNTIMQSPEWYDTAIFISWDDWGGFYDHVNPPKVDENGYGFRVPGLVISPYAKNGYIDHQNLSHDSYLKFIEDIFINGQRIDNKSGRPDKRPIVRENVSELGDLRNDFDFSQSPRSPLILPVQK